MDKLFAIQLRKLQGTMHSVNKIKIQEIKLERIEKEMNNPPDFE